MTTSSNDIFNLDFSVFVDISTPSPTVRFVNLSSGPNLAACKWVFGVFTPNNTPVHPSTFASPDKTGVWNNYTFPENLPQPGGNVIWSGSPYRFKVSVQDSAGETFTLEVKKEICAPSGNVCGSNAGLADVEVVVRCEQARIYVEDKTNYAYKKQVLASRVVKKRLTLVYPPTEQGEYPEPFVIDNFSNGLIPISFSAEGYQLILESVLQYDLGDKVTVQLKYKFRESFAVQCNIDLCEIVSEYNELVRKVQNTCDEELSETLVVINAKITQALIGKMQPLCGVDVAKLVEEIKELGGFTCDCRRSNGIVALINQPSTASGPTDCNSVIACINAMFNDLDPKCLADSSEWSGTELPGKVQILIDAISEDKCAPCPAPSNLKYDVLAKKLSWVSTGSNHIWNIEYKRLADAEYTFIGSPLPAYIGNNVWEVDLSDIVFEAAQSYNFAVTAACGSSRISDKILSGSYIPNGCTPISFTDISLPGALSGQAYVQNIALTGTAPFNLTSITKPAWMSMAVVGSVLQITGTPASGDIGSGLSVKVTVNNTCGSQSLDKTITVAAACTPVSFTDPTLASGISGQPYLKNVALSGTAPFTLSGMVKPSWMVVQISGSTLQITGTPAAGDAGTGITVKFTVNNACGSQVIDKTISVTLACVAVNFTDPVLPDNLTGVAYAKNITLFGTAPFNITGVTKPSWMQLNVVGSVLQITGTPTSADTGSDLPVKFTVNNACGSQSVDQTINVTSSCIAAFFTAPTTFPSAVVGVPYSQNITVSGTAPFAIGAITKPDWMSIDLVGNTVQITGTPLTGDTEAGIPIAFTVSNACGNQTLNRVIPIGQYNFMYGVGARPATEADILLGFGGWADHNETAVIPGYPNTTPSLLWYAEPLAEPQKTDWWNSVSNFGKIESDGTFVLPVVVGSWRVYVTGFETLFFGAVEMRINTPLEVPVSGTISYTAKIVTVNIGAPLSCDITFSLNGKADEGDSTLTDFSVDVTILAGQTSGSNSVGPTGAIINCMQPSVSGTNTLEYGQSCAGVTYIFTLTITGSAC